MATAIDTYNKIINNMDQTWRVNDAKRMNVLKRVITWLDHPEDQMKVIHIGGTNGKGSIGAMISSTIQATGKRVCLFSTPFIIHDNEQIRLNGESISPEEFVAAYNQIHRVLLYHGRAQDFLSYFEWWTLIAIVAAANANCEFLILEVGLGGERDATNIIHPPLLTLMTKVGIDHVNILGHTIKEIAEVKSKIIKKGSYVINYPGQQASVTKILKERVTAVGAQWTKVPHPKVHVASNTLRGMTLTIDGQEGYRLNLLGNFQEANVVEAITALRQLEELGEIELTPTALKRGLARTSIPGRLKYLREKHILFGGAHNIDGMKALVQSMKYWQLSVKPTLILGVLKDKDYQDMLKIVMPFVGRVITVTPANEKRALSADDLAAEILLNFPKVEVEIAGDPTAALSLASSLREPNALIIVTGSMYTLRAMHGQE